MGRYKTGKYKEVDGIKVPIYEWAQDGKSFIKVYHSFLAGMGKLNSLAGNLIIYLADTMGPDARVYNNKAVKTEFIEEMKKIGVEYSYSGLNRAFKDLEDAGLLRREFHGVYRVNPQFIWKGDEKSRVSMIKYTIMFTGPDRIETKVEELRKDI